jgi:hypothetical protein
LEKDKMRTETANKHDYKGDLPRCKCCGHIINPEFENIECLNCEQNRFDWEQEQAELQRHREEAESFEE